MQQTRQSKLIAPNDHGLVTMPSGSMRIVQLRPGGVINLGKFGHFLVDQTFGYAYGQAFEIIEEKKVVPVKDLSTEFEESREATPGPVVPDFKSSANNKDLVDLGQKIQGLTAQDIEKMKKEGEGNAVARQIIEKMIQSHEAFDKKTLFSQEKYLTRKQKKFTRRFQIDYLSSSALVKYYYQEKDPQRVLDLSEETLGLMMSHANIMPGGSYLVLDETGGLLVYAILERMQGQGSVVWLHENDQPNTWILKQSGYSETQLDEMIRPISFLEFFEPESHTGPVFKFTEQEVAEMSQSRKQSYLRRLAKADKLQQTVDMVTRNELDALVSMSTLNPSTLIPRVLERLAGSRPVVAYHQYKEMLIELDHILQKDKRVIMTSIAETKVRRFQTVPGKMHPLMTSRAGGGYVFVGLRVLPAEGVQAVGRGKKRKTEET
ncbi:hypothetical protein OGAPHI_004573 [Ogataea philodendri]|uniref:tRNA (adenine(58)-N(1))-methyltransferase non-catalytic subunit TRM6 n=1 Tax=Ogataea philodendri TaxID=1378263 RepID=A0A9P8P2W2_9ASCO|nr:uncharacterized protein OGAPHI_004573 [Ogataea philodendri]KAH3664222.1 hypothetical protein OGAPHI_004573 [Ogataea philodendri]